MADNVIVRVARSDDIPALLRMGRAMHDESPRYRDLAFDPGKLGMTLVALVARGGAFVAERDGELVGMIGGFVVEHFFGPEKIASDFGIYIAPGHRGGRLAVRLVRAFESWARDQGAVDIVLGISTDIAAARVAQLYERLGYAQSGYTMIKRLGHV